MTIPDTKPKILFFDIETAPNLAWVWAMWEQDVIALKKEWYILSFAAKWLNGKTIVRTLPDYPIYKKDKENDKDLIRELWELINTADVVIAHNGNEFDIKKANVRFIKHGLLPPADFKTIDTLKIARKYFNFNSNSLNDLGIFLGVGGKIKVDKSVWLGCLNGDPLAWKKMRRYNRRDMTLLYDVYMRLRPWIADHPNFSLTGGCPKCGSSKLHQRGYGITRTGKYPRYQCQQCASWSRGKHKQLTTIR